MFLALSTSDVVFIMLINVKMPKIYINEQHKFRAQLSLALKNVVTSGPGSAFIIQEYLEIYEYYQVGYRVGFVLIHFTQEMMVMLVPGP